ncbi:GEM-like protein 4 [Chenopodium quinoa]|uniref:GRAM domain-containing protein n=1 Tax=Chenopodium quinoa TaxID=63459 RepID=A0A803MNT9_CHEQI|nr:GEM-like protein 4 [Chenopodium quinoa]
MEGADAFRSLKCMLGDHVLKIESSINDQNKLVKLLPAPSSRIADGYNSKNMMQSKKESVISTMNKLAKGKLSLGANILQVGGVEKVFRRIFTVNEGEKLLKASQCCLFTTAGALTGRLFISTENLAFCSDKAIAKYSSPSGKTCRYHYKVVIPLRNFKQANQSENVKRPSKKYLQVVTNDEYEFWFAGFLNYKKTFKSLQQAISGTL